MSDSGVKVDYLDNLRTLRITSLDDEEEGDETLIGDDANAADFYDEDEEDGEEIPVTLGFVEKPNHQWSLLRHLFPSKAGGTPAWLDPINLPSRRLCLCGICGEPLQFLLQVYAPLTEKDSTFHRTLFVFMCPYMSCLLKDQHEQWRHNQETASRSVKVLRCQLPRSNPFYSHEPPKNDGSDKPLGVGAALCTWCGTWKGDKVCSNCRKARYCSEKHQTIHWRSGHKPQCRELNITPHASESSSSNYSGEVQKAAASKTPWPQFEIVNEDEPEFDAEISNIDTLNSAQLIEPLSNITGPANSILDTDEGDDDKKSWVSFHRRIMRAPEQVLSQSFHRFPGILELQDLNPYGQCQVAGHQLMIFLNAVFCGRHRTFEFQILPQLLYYFAVKNDVDSLDWATITVYTCEASCEGSLAYKEEFAWVQLVSQSTMGPR